MKKTLFAAIAILLVTTACTKEKKEEEVTPTGTNGYPVTYTFESVTNISAIRTFTPTAEISAPNCTAAQDYFLVDFPGYIASTNVDYRNSMKVVILSDNQVRYGYGTGFDTIVSYTMSGNIMTIAGVLEMEKTSTGLKHQEFYAARPHTPGDTTGTVGLETNYGSNLTILEAINEDFIQPGDTVALRTFQVNLKKN